MAQNTNTILNERIAEKVILPILENNVVEDSDSEEDLSALNPQQPDGTWLDGGKLHPRTQREVSKLVARKFYFPNFNILLYAENVIFKVASSLETKESNRDAIYDLYYKALNLQPEPEVPELTFS
eukprot:CAMPEP_0176346962 /NCGR_PEP_ID=MMETSP0126-20121128/6655_1 /TAXON_ID=141414 ORGANISM="Strombidinopsis acuminatum, Strain SPMC142" /NCGR_SAMPLE_ID=MMETSP0126 /ASSEMBLY_ACC=CAM_ASM_000229 /LENGTH=124 /DNA_ID=CAMNT_0017694809 /DNA_START=735 /DNA_END=1109 /DNA_ORIENTATION=+